MTNKMGLCMSRPSVKPKYIYVRDKIVDKAASEISIHSVYKIGKNIGTGSFGVVASAYNLSSPKEKVAIKIILKNKLNTSAKRIKYEIDIIITLDHPNIIKCYETFEDEKHIYIVMEFCSGGELLDILPKDRLLDEDLCLEFVRKMLVSVNHIHQIGIVHRDLKPENFLFNNTKPERELKLVDFGLSNKFSNKFEILHSTVGTPFYIAPEVLKGNYDSKCDMWSLGVIFYLILSGELPFYGENVREVFKRIETGVYSMQGPRWDAISEETKHLISRLLCLNVQDRLSSYEALMHPAIHKISLPLESFILIHKLREYSELSNLKRCIGRALVRNLDFDKIAEQRNVFYTLDRNLTGIIGALEMCDAYEEAGKEVSQVEVSKLFSSVGLRQKGKLYFSEFISVMINWRDYFTEEYVKLSFEFFDRNRKGFFDMKDYIEAIDYMGGKITYEEAEAQIKEVAKGGKIFMQDFKKVFTGEID